MPGNCTTLQLLLLLSCFLSYCVFHCHHPFVAIIIFNCHVCCHRLYIINYIVYRCRFYRHDCYLLHTSTSHILPFY